MGDSPVRLHHAVPFGMQVIAREPRGASGLSHLAWQLDPVDELAKWSGVRTGWELPDDALTDRS